MLAQMLGRNPCRSNANATVTLARMRAERGAIELLQARSRVHRLRSVVAFDNRDIHDRFVLSQHHGFGVFGRAIAFGHSAISRKLDHDCAWAGLAFGSFVGPATNQEPAAVFPEGLR